MSVGVQQPSQAHSSCLSWELITEGMFFICIVFTFNPHSLLQYFEFNYSLEHTRNKLQYCRAMENEFQEDLKIRKDKWNTWEQELPEKLNLKPLDSKDVEKLGHLNKFLDFVLWMLLRKISTLSDGASEVLILEPGGETEGLPEFLHTNAKWNSHVTAVSAKSVLVTMLSTPEPRGNFYINCSQYESCRNEWTFSFVHCCTFHLLHFPYLLFICFPFASDAHFDTLLGILGISL